MESVILMGIQAVGKSDELMGHTSLSKKFEAFGWAAREIDGSDMKTIVATLAALPFEPGRPSAIVARTRLGVSFMEGDAGWHGKAPNAEQTALALAQLGDALGLLGETHEGHEDGDIPATEGGSR